MVRPMAGASFAWSLLGTRWWLLASVLYPLCFLSGIDGAAWRWTLPWWLGGILFFTALRIPGDSLREAFADRERWRLAWGFAVVRLIITPVLLWGIAWCVAPEWAPGVLLVAAMPAGLSSIALADLMRGDRLLALLAVVASSAAAPVTIPLLVQAFGPREVTVQAAQVAERAGYIGLLLATPLAAAQGVRALAPRLIMAGDLWWPRAAVTCSLVLGAACILTNYRAWAPFAWLGLLTPLGLASLVVGLHLILALVSRRFLRRDRADGLACGGVYLNNGLAMAFAAAFFPHDGRMLLPALLLILPTVAAMAWLGRGSSSGAPRHQELHQS